MTFVRLAYNLFKALKKFEVSYAVYFIYYDFTKIKKVKVKNDMDAKFILSKSYKAM